MTLAFILSMPGRSSWNGRWSGEDRCYAITKVFKSKAQIEKAREILQRGYYSYGWSDGWRAGIQVKDLSQVEATKLRRKSAGFCGYDWMVDSILRHGAIYASQDEIPKAEVEVSP